jgi:hypothetical protein
MMRGLLAGIVALLVLGLVGGWLLHRAYTAQDTAILLDAAAASWIKAPGPTSLKARPEARVLTAFFRSFALPTVPAEVTLRVRSFRRSLVSVNGVSLEPRRSGMTPWVKGDSYKIATTLREGDNLVVVVVESERGPPALLIETDLPELRTGPGWEAYPESGEIGGVRLLSERLSHPIQKAFPTASDALRSVALYLAGAFLLGALGARALAAWARSRPAPIVTPSRMRWLLMGAWALLCANNLVQLPLALGFDARGHRQYIEMIANGGRLPLATDGWQTFQSPLYHLLAAGLYRIAGLVVSEPHAFFVARLIPMLCGLALIGIAYRSGGRVFPNRPDLRILALVIAGTIPMSFYICQEIGNEPLAGVLGAALLDLCLLEITVRDRPWAAWRGARLGAVFGLALLSKITLLLLLPVLVWVSWMRTRDRGMPSLVAAGASFSLALTLVSGWYFLRNWILLGHLFMDGWDPARGMAWWQDPGYRTVHDFLRFGDALARPVWSVLSGFWDGLYSTVWLDGTLSSETLARTAPPWNYDFMVALAPMALPLTLAILVGIALIPATRDRSTRVALAMLAAVGLCFVCAIAYLFLKLPIYSTVKGTYALSLVPALGLLAARGLEGLVARSWGRTVLTGYLSSWVVCVFAAFWIR